MHIVKLMHLFGLVDFAFIFLSQLLFIQEILNSIHSPFHFLFFYWREENIFLQFVYRSLQHISCYLRYHLSFAVCQICPRNISEFYHFHLNDRTLLLKSIWYHQEKFWDNERCLLDSFLDMKVQVCLHQWLTWSLGKTNYYHTHSVLQVQKCDRIPLKTHSSLPKQLGWFFILPDSLALALAIESDQFHF